MKSVIKDLLQMVKPYLKKEGYNDTRVPRLKIIYYTQSQKIENVYNPSFCLLLQGEKETILSDEHYKYRSGDFILASAQLPVSGNIVASKDVPNIAILIDLDPLMVVEIIKDSPGTQSTTVSQRAIYTEKPDADLLDAIARLVKCLRDKNEAEILGPLITKEIIFRLVNSHKGDVLRQLGLIGSHAIKVRMAITEIVNNFAEKININDLATKLDMSASSFHKHFKDVTSMSPLQYQKNVRLLEAKRLLLSGNDDVANVAFKVGYESPSQFSREYARHYGVAPKIDREVKRKLQKNNAGSTPPPSDLKDRYANQKIKLS